MTRQNQALQARLNAANYQATVTYGTQQTNGDEGLYSDYRASFTKTLPHNSFGEVDTSEYDALLNAFASGAPQDFEAINLGGDRKLANPQAAYRFEMVGLDPHKTFMPAAPNFASLETAAEMGELYWKYLCRDVPFIDYGTNALIQSAITDLNAFSQTVGPNNNGAVDQGTVFRSDTAGNLIGPFISQLLLHDIPYGSTTIAQSYAAPNAQQDYMNDVSSWLSIQNGVSPSPVSYSTPRYINDGRALAEFVHSDYSYQAYLNAALILLSIPNSYDVSNPYLASNTQGPFITFGGPDVLDLVAKAANLALSGAWYQKWLVHRRLRPEAYSGRVHFQKLGQKAYDLPDEILDCDGVARSFAQNGTYLLPQSYIEGSPTHPAYPAGHATIAGACCTILKAFFREDMAYPNPVQANAAGNALTSYSGGDTLTLGGEINKLANNISLGRDWAGVHYRSDSILGCPVGEQHAIGLLEDYSRSYNEEFEGFTLTKFDGTTTRIQNGVST